MWGVTDKVMIVEKRGKGDEIGGRTLVGLASLSFPPVHIDSLLGLIWDFIKVVLRPALHFNLRILLPVLVHTRGCIQVYSMASTVCAFLISRNMILGHTLHSCQLSTVLQIIIVWRHSCAKQLNLL